MTPGALITAKLGIAYAVFLVLMLVPFPAAAEPFRPQWIAMLVLYAGLFQPRSFGVFSAWLIGILTDVATGSLLGQHAFCFAVLAYLSHGVVRQYALLSVLQQLLISMVALGIYLILRAAILGIAGTPLDLSQQWLTLMTSLILWHWMSALLEQTIGAE